MCCSKVDDIGFYQEPLWINAYSYTLAVTIKTVVSVQ